MGDSEIIGIIQIVVGVVALAVAVFGLFKILEQIKISNEQTKLALKNQQDASDQAAAEIKLKFIELTLLIIEKNHTTILEIQELIDIYEDVLSSDEELDQEDIDSGKDNISTLIKSLDDVEEFNTMLENMFKRILENWDYDYKKSRDNIDRLVTILRWMNKESFKFKSIRSKLNMAIIKE